MGEIAGNSGMKFDSSILDLGSKISLGALKDFCSRIQSRASKLDKETQVQWLVKCVSCIDLTTLAGDDTPSRVQRLCAKSMSPLHPDLLKALNLPEGSLTTGAVCVYPARVHDCVKSYEVLTRDAKLDSRSERIKVPHIAAVSTGFPTGQYPLKSRLGETRFAVEQGANEIDIVINRCAALCGDWQLVYDEVRAMKEACGSAHMKTILATGELGSMANVYKASMTCMMAGADFIKTSTGKEGVNAILPVGVVMARAIADYHQMTGVRVGFKPAGGIRTSKDALEWQLMMSSVLGKEYLEPYLFRFGASGLLGDVEQQLFKLSTGKGRALPAF